MDLLAAIGEQRQERARSEMAGQKEQELETGVVAPMYVFNDEDQGRCSPARARSVSGPQEAAFLLFWLRAGVGVTLAARARGRAGF